jgi:hypothetical protein
MVPSAVGLVIARYLTDPARFDPERGGLAGYLAMEVRGDVRNELDSRRRRRRHESPAARWRLRRDCQERITSLPS